MTRGNLSSGRRAEFCHWSFYVTPIVRIKTGPVASSGPDFVLNRRSTSVV